MKWNTSIKDGGSVMTVTMQFPEEMRGEVESYFSNVRTIKETDLYL